MYLHPLQNICAYLTVMTRIEIKIQATVPLLMKLTFPDLLLTHAHSHIIAKAPLIARFVPFL